MKKEGPTDYTERHRIFFVIIFLFFFCVFLCVLWAVTGHYLLMQPIEDSIRTGDFTHFKEISKKKISVNFEPPFDLQGYVFIDKFIEDFSSIYAQYKVEKIEWSSKHIEENFAVQSLNVILKDTRSKQDLYYKFIFFMKKNIKWKIYYLRGLRI